MKGVIADCLTELIQTKFGAAQLDAVFSSAKVPKQRFLATENIPDQEVLKLFGAACSVLRISEEKAAEAFGEYWCVTYAPRIYKGYFVGAKGAKQFLMGMKRIHETVTQSIPDAHPPVFDFVDTAPNKLTMSYSSQRNLQPIWLGCVKGVGVAFKEKLSIKQKDRNSIEITFG